MNYPKTDKPEAIDDETLDQVTGGSMTLTNDADDVDVVASGKAKLGDLMMVKHVDSTAASTVKFDDVVIKKHIDP